ncbi:MAG: hypothetical protein HN341_16470 [Verrucomicrobia bacterium]|nr:hypothetical protein [Verrucomicrobiota bacterium]
MPARHLTGHEPFHRAGHQLEHRVLNFWRWSSSELLGNTLRGVLAEYLVALDLGVADGFRTEWDAFDLQTSTGITVEVKSGAYVQTWHQDRPSKISFGIAPTRAWDPTTGTYGTEYRRQAQVYVFCVLGEKDQAEADPLDLHQWQFHVLAAQVLNGRLGEQKTLTLGSLLKLGPDTVAHGQINVAVQRASMTGS